MTNGIIRIEEINGQQAVSAIGVEKIKNAKRGDINFYLCDNIEFMKTKPDKYYDLAIVDPPYGIGDKFKGGKTGKMNFNEIVNKDWDKVPTPEYWEQLFRVSKNQIVWGGNYFNLPPTRCFIVWDKGISEDFSLAMAELAWTSFDKLAKIIRLPTPKDGKRHPTQKPIKLYRKLLIDYAEKGMKILDTHGGSFTNSIACDMEGFALDICEIDEEYFNNGLKAYDEYKRQTKLF
jgi:site-specific DNA-methyltransferase (adenine-specific)